MNEFLNGPIVIGIAAWLAYLISFAVCRAAVWAKVIPDHPNHRSSHVHTTSKAGGLGVVGGWLAGIAIIAIYFDQPGFSRDAAMVAAGTIAAFLIGLADDIYDCPPFAKLGGQFFLAAFFVWAFGPLAVVPVPGFGVLPLPEPIGAAVTVIWIVGFMNAFNFMDGVNGIAGGCAAAGMAAFAIIAALGGAMFPAIAALLLVVACFGFLPSNFFHGRVFMGDNGSQAISFLIAALAILAASGAAALSPLIAPLIFLPFLFDVAWTLVHRGLRGQNVLQAHREHNYQLLHQLGRDQKRVATLYIMATVTCAVLASIVAPAQAYVQWLAIGAVSLVFCAFAAKIYGQANQAGLFSQTTTEHERKIQAAE